MVYIAPVKNRLLYVSTWLQSTKFQRKMMRLRIFVSWALFRCSYHSSTMATLFYYCSQFFLHVT